jgi:elongation factor P
MATLAYNEILPKTVIVMNGEPFLVLDAHVFRKQQRKPVNQTKIKSLKTGRVIEQTFHQNETAVEAELEKKHIEFVYENRGTYWFCESGKPAHRFELPHAVVGDAISFIKPKSEVEALVFNEEIIGVKVPIKVELMVKEAAPAIKGNTVQGGSKEVILETGAKLNVPMFINEGDVVRVNTESGEYTERVSKA